MNVRNEKKVVDTGQYDDAVLEAGGLPPVELPGTVDSPNEPTSPSDTKVEAEAFLEAYYRNQE